MAYQVPPYARPPDLPYFEHPPVTEVHMGMQLQGLRLRAFQLGDLYNRLSEHYPVVEEHLPPPMQVEQFAKPPLSGVQFQFQILDRPPLPLVVFMNDDRSSLIQFDNNRFYFAWRRATDDTQYPRYDKLRAEFIRNAIIFDDFLRSAGVEIQRATQAEIAYVNDIPMTNGERPDVLVEDLPGISRDKDPMRLGTEGVFSVSAEQRFTYRTEGGVDYARLRVNSEPVTVETQEVLRLSLVYRGEPYQKFGPGPGLSPSVQLMDEGHDRIVRAFTVNTTLESHRTWGGAQGD